jgi:hypothetical protein
MVQETPTRLRFNGSNWEDLNRLVALAKFKFLQDSDYFIEHDDGTRTPRQEARCAYLAEQFEGPALDWVGSIFGTAPNTFSNFDGFVTAVRQGFGVADENITALCRAKLDDLHMGQDVPSFFAELDRLFLALGITGDSTMIAYAQGKLSPHFKRILAEQGRVFHNYSTMREHCNSVWALSPRASSSNSKKPRCGSCGKKGHTAPECRGSKN